MPARRLRRSLIGVWMALTCVTLTADSAPARGALLFLGFGLMPAAAFHVLRNERQVLGIRAGGSQRSHL